MRQWLGSMSSRRSRKPTVTIARPAVTGMSTLRLWRSSTRGLSGSSARAFSFHRRKVATIADAIAHLAIRLRLYFNSPGDARLTLGSIEGAHHRDCSSSSELDDRRVLEDPRLGATTLRLSNHRAREGVGFDHHA